MIFEQTPLEGAFIVELEPHTDERGGFARTFCAREFSEHGLASSMVQSSICFNRRRGTLRGMHYQLPPSKEGKLIRCQKGRIFDVIIDLRPQSRTFCKHFGLELDAPSGRAVYAPCGMAHGYQTLEDDTEVHYQMSDYYAPDLAAGVRWDDPAFGIDWPIDKPIMLHRDANYPDFEAARIQS